MMKKVSTGISNNFCPQTLFLYGTYKQDGTPNFGLFCWFSYCWDGQLHVMACIGGSKLTKDRIKETGIFSANLVTEPMLPLADYFGNKQGYEPDKMSVDISVMKGSKLNVPVLTESPWSYELKVKQSLKLDDGEIFICKIENILAFEELLDKNTDIQKRMEMASPVITTAQTYFTVGKKIGAWGEWKK